jgi:hypothetical protein
VTPLPYGLLVLVVLALPVASIAWSVTHEDIFRDAREALIRRSERARSLVLRKFVYVFTCEYCFSHWVVAGVLLLTHFKLLYDDWRGYLVSGFALVWVANHYMSLFGRLRLGIRSERIDVSLKEDLKQELQTQVKGKKDKVA